MDRIKESYKDMIDNRRYLISNYGNVLDKDTGECVRVHTTKKGYQRVNLTSPDGKVRPKALHRVVALNFVYGYKEGLQIHHLDNNPSNNYYLNLMWVTEMQNQSFKLHGTPVRVTLCSPDGEILTYPSIGSICKDNGLTRKAIENLLLGKIKSFKGWTLPDKYYSSL